MRSSILFVLFSPFLLVGALAWFAEQRTVFTDRGIRLTSKVLLYSRSREHAIDEILGLGYSDSVIYIELKEKDAAPESPRNGAARPMKIQWAWNTPKRQIANNLSRREARQVYRLLCEKLDGAVAGLGYSGE